MTELAVREPYQPDRIIQRSGGIFERDIIDGWVQVLADVQTLANFIAETDFVPKSLRNKPAAVAACILTGRELGIGPMQSLKSIHMVQGVPSLSAEYKRARALSAGHDIVFDETNSTRCIVRGRRSGSDRWVTITWNLDMAKRARLAGKDVWQQYPQRMLQARASGELCDLLFPDASLGLATTEVLEDGGIVALESGELVDAATGEVTSGTAPAAIDAPKPKTAQRASRRPTTAAPADGSTQAPQKPPTPAPAHAPTAPPGDPGLPPLPGEEETSPEDKPGSVTSEQLKRIWATLTNEFGFRHDEQDAARAACARIAGCDLASSKDLSFRQAGAVIDTLAGYAETARRQHRPARDVLADLHALPAREAAPAAPPEAADPRDAVIAAFDGLGVTGPDIAAYLTRLAGRDLASVESLSRQQAGWFVDRLAKIGSRDELEAAATAAEAKREEAATNGE